MQDDDSALAEVTAGSALDWVREGDDMVYFVTRRGSVENALDVSLRLDEMRLRTSPEELSDAAAAVTEPEGLDIISETVNTQFAAGERSITITRAVPVDDFNTGDYTLSLLVLPGAYFIAGTAQTVWVQDDDRATLTVTEATEDYHRFGPEKYLTVARSGDTSRKLWFKLFAETAYRNPLPDEEVIGSGATRFSIDAGSVSRDLRTIPFFVSTYFYVPGGRGWGPLGAYGQADLVSIVCPIPGQGGCGYQVQYYVDNPTQVYEAYNDFMGVYIESGQAGIDEGETATYTFTRYGGGADNLERPLHVAIEVTQDGDYIVGSAPRMVSFLADETTATISIPTAVDEVDESHGCITVRLLESADRTDFERSYDIGYYSGVYARVEATTAVDDVRSVSVSDAQTVEYHARTDRVGRLEFTVSLNSPTLERTVTVDWATGDDRRGGRRRC